MCAHAWVCVLIQHVSASLVVYKLPHCALNEEGGGHTSAPDRGRCCWHVWVSLYCIIHPLCHISSWSGQSDIMQQKDTHLKHTLKAYFQTFVWCVWGCGGDFLWYVNVPEGGFTSLHSPAPRISHQAVDNDAFEVVFSSSFQAESGFWLDKQCEFVCVHTCVTSGTISNRNMLPQPSATPSLSFPPTLQGINLEMFY